MLCLIVDWELESNESCPRPVLSSTSSTWSLVRFWPAKIGEGSSFLGEIFENNVRLVGVPATESDCLFWCAGDRHVLVSFSPKMRRPSLIGLKGIVVDCISRRLRVQLRSGEGVMDQKDRKMHDVAGEVGSGSGASTRETNTDNWYSRDKGRSEENRRWKSKRKKRKKEEVECENSKTSKSAEQEKRRKKRARQSRIEPPRLLALYSIEHGRGLHSVWSCWARVHGLREVISCKLWVINSLCLHNWI